MAIAVQVNERWERVGQQLKELNIPTDGVTLEGASLDLVAELTNRVRTAEKAAQTVLQVVEGEVGRRARRARADLGGPSDPPRQVQVIVRGPRGAGKPVLAQFLADTLEAKGFRVEHQKGEALALGSALSELVARVWIQVRHEDQK